VDLFNKWKRLISELEGFFTFFFKVES
jgi:hypothetical protein